MIQFISQMIRNFVTIYITECFKTTDDVYSSYEVWEIQQGGYAVYGVVMEIYKFWSGAKFFKKNVPAWNSFFEKVENLFWFSFLVLSKSSHQLPQNTH